MIGIRKVIMRDMVKTNTKLTQNPRPTTKPQSARVDCFLRAPITSTVNTATFGHAAPRKNHKSASELGNSHFVIPNAIRPTKGSKVYTDKRTTAQRMERSWLTALPLDYEVRIKFNSFFVGREALSLPIPFPNLDIRRLFVNEYERAEVTLD